MNQPPPPTTKPRDRPSRRPDWLRPAGVAEGTWAYTQQRSIADHYADFVDGTPLCRLDTRWLEQFFPACSEEIAEGKRPLILDLGCGNGRSLIPLSRRGYRTLGVDLSQPMLAAFAGKSWKVRCNLVDLQCLASESVDHVICLFSTLGMIQGKANRLAVLSHARRIVRPRGSLTLHVHNRANQWTEPGGWWRTMRSCWRSFFDRDHEHGDTVYAYRGLENMYLHRFARREVTELIRRSGWSLRELRLISDDGTSFVDLPCWQRHRASGFLMIADADS